MSDSLDSADARSRDERDVLAAFRERFVVAEEELIYLLGNSLAGCHETQPGGSMTWSAWSGASG